MHDTHEEDTGPARDARVPLPAGIPPLRLAGIDEDDTWEPHLVRGID
ncbi:hypothetical protein [Streptomyces sp. NPDC002564]